MKRPFRVYSRVWPCGISAIWKKMPHKIYVGASNWAQKNRPMNRTINHRTFHSIDLWTFFEIKYSKKSSTTTLIWRPLYKLTLNFFSLLLSHMPFSSSFESLFHQANIRDSAKIWAQAFSVAQNVPKWRQSVNKRSFSHGTVCTNKFKYFRGDHLSWTPFLQKGPPKITEGSPFDPHWLISRINPAFFFVCLFCYKIWVPTCSWGSRDSNDLASPGLRLPFLSCKKIMKQYLPS